MSSKNGCIIGRKKLDLEKEWVARPPSPSGGGTENQGKGGGRKVAGVCGARIRPAETQSRETFTGIWTGNKERKHKTSMRFGTIKRGLPTAGRSVMW